MTDKSFVPNVEPPPPSSSSIGLGISGTAEANPANVLNQPDINSLHQGPQSQNPSPIPPSKRGIPSIAKYILIGLGSLIVIFAVILLIRSGGSTTLVGTKGEISWWGVTDQEQVIKPLIDEFQSKNPNVKITYIKQSEVDYRERLTNALASGQGPDIFEIHNSWGNMFKNEVSVAPEKVISKDEFTRSFYPIATVDLTNTSGIFAIPLEYDALTLFINKDIFTSALKVPPKTWIELSELAKENVLTQRGSNTLIAQSGVALGLTENVDYWPEIFGLMMVQNGANLQKPAEDVTRDAVSFYVNFNKGIKAWDSTMPLSTSAFARGRLAMYFGTTKSVADILKENQNIRMRTVPLPQLPKERPSDPDMSYATYWAQSVWKRSSNVEIAWSFLKYLSTPESLQAMNRNRKNLNIQEKVYPRPDMAIFQSEDEILGSFVALAPVARSWFLAHKTFDGPTGINSQINKVYEDVIATSLDNQDLNKAVKSLPDKVNEIITKFTSVRK